MWQGAFRCGSISWFVLGMGFLAWVMAHFWCLMLFGVILSGNVSTMTIGSWALLAISLTWSLLGWKTTKRFWRFSNLVERYTRRDRRFNHGQPRT